MADATLLRGRRRDHYLAKVTQLLFECREAGSKDAVIIREQNSHGVPSFLEWLGPKETRPLPRGDSANVARICKIVPIDRESGIATDPPNAVVSKTL